MVDSGGKEKFAFSAVFRSPLIERTGGPRMGALKEVMGPWTRVTLGSQQELGEEFPHFQYDCTTSGHNH
jgi:hypothetical protein